MSTSSTTTAEQRVYSLTEFAALAGRTRDWAAQLVERGLIQTIRIGRGVYVTRAEADRVLTEGTSPAEKSP